MMRFTCVKKPSRWLFTALVVALVIGIGLRVWHLNSNPPTYPRVDHSMGEDIELDGAFAEFAYENTDGYSIAVTNAERMSPREYLDRYARGPSVPENPYDSTDEEAKVLIVLDIEIRNDKKSSEDRGYLDSIGWSLIPEEKKERWLRVDSSLFGLSVPQIEGAFQLSVKPGTEYTVHVPFSTSIYDEFPASAGMGHKPLLDSGSYDFFVTNVPTRHVVTIDVP